MNRFFVEKQNIFEDYALVRGEDVKHISRVLRMKEGEPLLLCDGVSMEYMGVLASISEDEIRVQLTQGHACENELPYKVTLLQGLPKAGKMEWIIQKCTELGVHEVLPVSAARSVVRISEKEFEKKRARYEKVAAEAAKQSQRGAQPRVLGLKSFEDIDYSAYDLILLFYEEEKKRTLKSVLQNLKEKPAHIALIIGPEGGIEREEADRILSKGGVAVSLGKRILRTETAGMAALSMLQYELGEA